MCEEQEKINEEMEMEIMRQEFIANHQFLGLNGYDYDDYKRKKLNKEAIWLFAELFSVITITDSHDKIYTTFGLFFPIQPKVW